MQRKSYFAEFEIVAHDKKSIRITVTGPEFNNEIEAEQNLHYLQKKFEVCIDSESDEYEYMRYCSVMEKTHETRPIDKPETFSEFLSKKDDIKTVRDYESDPSSWTPRTT